LYVADVGQNRFEEVNYQPNPVASGLNYGWDIAEGRHCHEPMSGCSMAGFVSPVVEYCHSTGNDPMTCDAGQLGCSVTGGYAYRGCAMPDLQGRYFYSDYCSAFVRSFDGVLGGDAQDVQEHTVGGSFSIDLVTSFGEDARGELYIADQNSGGFDGEVFKLVPGP
jgi:hypothetical protein